MRSPRRATSNPRRMKKTANPTRYSASQRMIFSSAVVITGWMIRYRAKSVAFEIGFTFTISFIHHGMRDNIERFDAVQENLLRQKKQKMTKREAEQVHQIEVMLGLMFNRLACWLAIGFPESEAKKSLGRSCRNVVRLL
jgi:hypothetical protein